jgi:hypothetical protein
MVVAVVMAEAEAHVDVMRVAGGARERCVAAIRNMCAVSAKSVNHTFLYRSRFTLDLSARYYFNMITQRECRCVFSLGGICSWMFQQRNVLGYNDARTRTKWKGGRPRGRKYQGETKGRPMEEWGGVFSREGGGGGILLFSGTKGRKL